MAIASNDWFEQVKYYVHRAVDQALYVVEGTISSRQLNPPSVKVILQPYGIETGWIRVGTPYGGNGFGFLAIPPEGMVVKVIFDCGDHSSAAVVTDMYNDVDVPPALADIDDAALVHASGSKLYFHKNGDVEVTATGNLILNGGTAGVARVGDTITGTTSDGKTVTGTVTSGSAHVKA